MNRWYRQSLPPSFLNWGYFSVLLLIDLAGLFVWYMWGQSVTGPSRYRIMFPFAMVGAGLGIPTAALIAVCRIERFPGYRSDHYEWLATTPWHADNRTPFGPWHPVLTDAIPLAILSIFGMAHGMLLTCCLAESFDRASQTVLTSGLAPIAMFFVVWTVGGYVRVCWRWSWSVYSVLLTFGLLIMLAKYVNLLAAFAAGLLASLVAIFLVWRRMKSVLVQLPSRHLTDRDEPPFPRKSSFSIDGAYPYSVKSPMIEWLEVNRPRAFAYGLLSFVWVSFLPAGREFMIMVPFGVSLLALIRVIAFTERRASHLGLLARWATKRFIVPEFDRVWIPSLWMLLTAVLLAAVGYLDLLPPNLVVALSIGTSVFIALTSGPNFDHWALTAPYRMNRRANVQRRQTSSSLFHMTGINSDAARR